MGNFMTSKREMAQSLTRRNENSDREGFEPSESNPGSLDEVQNCDVGRLHNCVVKLAWFRTCGFVRNFIFLKKIIFIDNLWEIFT